MPNEQMKKLIKIINPELILISVFDLMLAVLYAIGMNLILGITGIALTMIIVFTIHLFFIHKLKKIQQIYGNKLDCTDISFLMNVVILYSILIIFILFFIIFEILAAIYSS